MARRALFGLLLACTTPLSRCMRDDSMSGAYKPKHDLVEPAPKGIVDLAAVAGRGGEKSGVAGE